MWKRFIYTAIIGILCNIESIAQEIIEPVFDRSDVPEFRVEKVTITQDTTFVYCSYQAEAGSWAMISKDTYLKDINNGKHFPLLKVTGLPCAPIRHKFIRNEAVQVLLCFSHIDTAKFDIIENINDTAFNIFGVNLLESYPVKYNWNEYWRFINMSEFYLSANNETKYLELKEKELQAAQFIFGKSSLPVSGCYKELSETYNRMGKYPEAIKQKMMELDCYSIIFGIENKEYPIYPMTLEILSTYYQNAGNDSAAIQCTKESIGIWRDIEETDNYLKGVYYLLLSGRDSSGIAKRIEISQKELNNLPSHVNDTTLYIAKIQSQMGFSYYQLGNFTQAVIWCDNALATLRKAGKISKKEFADVLSFKCLCQWRNGQIDDAISTGEVAMSLFDSSNVKTAKYAELLSVLAGMYYEKCDYEKAIIQEKNAAYIYEEAKAWLSLATSYSSISAYYRDKYDFNNAEIYIQKAIKIYDNYGDVSQCFLDTFNSTEVIEDEQREDITIDKAVLANPNRVRKIMDDINLFKIATKHALSRLYQKNNKLADAIRTEKEVGAFCDSIGDEREYANHLLYLSEYYLYNKQYENAIGSAERSLHIFERIDRKRAYAPLSFLGTIYNIFGDYDKSIQYCKEVLLLLDDAESSYNKENILSILSYSYYCNHNLVESEKCLSELLFILKNKICKDFANMTIAQKQRIWSMFEPDFLLYRNVIIESKANGNQLSELYNFVLFSKRLLLDTEINIDDYYSYTWKDIQRILSKDELAIEFITTNREGHKGNIYNALIIDKNCYSPQLITLNYDENLFNGTSYIGDIIWNPILSKYKNRKNIYFSPDGIIHVFPIEHLKTGSNGWISNEYNIYRLSSTKELLKKNNENKLDQAVLYGGLEYNQMSDLALEEKTGTLPSLLRGISERGGFDPLYNTLDEVNDIKGLLSNQHIATTLFAGNEGTEESFRKLSNMDVHILHLATHGMYIEPENVSSERQTKNFDFLESLNSEKDPVKEDVALTHSFLVMSGGNKLLQQDKVSSDDDGILTAKEISETDLKGVDLVVLSACESALGDINTEGVYGLQRGFKKAGVNTILMSLGKVDDEATRILMVEFYRNLMSGKTKLQSLKDAQKYLREYDNGKYDDPKYWASFIMLDGLN